MNEDNITLFNAYFDKETRTTKYNRSYLYGVDWQECKSMSINQVRGIMSADDILIFIPYNCYAEDKKYIKPKLYQQLDDSEKNDYFTFKENDKIVKGIIDYDISIDNTIKKLELSYDDVVDVKSITTCDMMGHFELGCE